VGVGVEQRLGEERELLPAHELGSVVEGADRAHNLGQGREVPGDVPEDPVLGELDLRLVTLLLRGVVGPREEVRRPEDQEEPDDRSEVARQGDRQIHDMRHVG